MQAISTPLNATVVQGIQAWLRTGESLEFRKLLSALATEAELAALKELGQSDGDDGYRASAFDSMDTARKYKFMLHVMDSATLGHTPEKPEEKFPFVSITLQQPNTSATVEALLNPKTDKPT